MKIEQPQNDNKGSAERVRARLAKLIGGDVWTKAQDAPAPLKAAEG